MCDQSCKHTLNIIVKVVDFFRVGYLTKSELNIFLKLHKYPQEQEVLFVAEHSCAPALAQTAPVRRDPPTTPENGNPVVAAVDAAPSGGVFRRDLQVGSDGQ